ncbi:MAG: hypothetical protein PHC90_08595 [Syntrophorhabdaceae bacterium]|nr:hypothetical protein [Syntrophorhabdaceae bacterium]
MKKLALVLVTVIFIVTSVGVCLADKGRDPPDPPVAPTPAPIDLSLSAPREGTPRVPVIPPSDGPSRHPSDRGDS